MNTRFILKNFTQIFKRFCSRSYPNQSAVTVTESEIQKRLIDPVGRKQTFQNLHEKGLTSKQVSKLKNANSNYVGSAVLMPFCFVQNELSVLFIIRSSFQPSHAGQVGFPGGRLDSEDRSVEDAVLRETFEEIGIPSHEIEIWNKVVSEKRISKSPIAIVFGFVKDFNHEMLNICEREVHGVFTVPIKDLLDPSKHGYTKFRWGYQMPVFVNKHRNVWGLTAMFTNIFLRSLFPETHRLSTFRSLQNIEETHR